MSLPIKYQLNLWKTLPSYPTKLDVLYEVNSFLLKTNKKEFSEQTLNSLWHDTSGSASWKGTPIEDRVRELMSDGVFEETRTTDKTWYKIREGSIC